MTVTISQSRTEEILNKLDAGDIDGISLREFMQISYLAMVGGDEVHLEMKIIYGGNTFNMHSCVSQVNPPLAAPTASLEAKI